MNNDAITAKLAAAAALLAEVQAALEARNPVAMSDDKAVLRYLRGAISQVDETSLRHQDR